jgi:hypothetical protein
MGTMAKIAEDMNPRSQKRDLGRPDLWLGLLPLLTAQSLHWLD